MLALALISVLAAGTIGPAPGSACEHACASRGRLGGACAPVHRSSGNSDIATASAPAADAPLVAIDAGHGPRAAGAVGARGTSERDLNLAVASRLAAAVRAAGLRAILVDARGDLGNAERAALAGRLGAAALVSIHHDSVQPRYLETWTVGGVARSYSDRFRGFSVFFSRSGARPDESLALARAVGAELRRIGLAATLHHAERIAGEGRELVDADLGVYRYDDLAVLHHASMPAILVECGILVNRDEELALRSPDRQGALAAAIARALASFLRARG